MDHRSYGDSCLFGNSAYDFGVSTDTRGSGNGDYGPLPCIFDLPRLAEENRDAEAVLWTGGALQLCRMRLLPGCCLGPERQLNLDQFFYILSGSGVLSMGSQAGNLQFSEPLRAGNGILVPAGTWLKLSARGSRALLLFRITAQHPLSGRAVPILDDRGGTEPSSL